MAVALATSVRAADTGGADPTAALVDALLGHANHKVRLKAAKRLGTDRSPLAADGLRQALNDEHPLVRAAAAN
ncbi:MAG: HEAT repeat domain-containing protein, partial [Myxococcales bacterium]|nr:HEAT repeat domain-containing protein [Myxococcales bacterium]